MAIAKELLDSLGNQDLALECDRASVYVKILVATWDGLSPEEATTLKSPPKATILTDDEIREIYQEQMDALNRGEAMEDDLLVKVKATMEKLPADKIEDMGKAIFAEAMTVLSIDNILSRQEREVVVKELAPILHVSTEDATAAVDAEAARMEADQKADA